jgi:ABC-type uncharacterized transport system permease subunit
LLAGLSPLGVLATGTFFGALEGGASAMQRVAAIPSSWVFAVEALVILSVLGVERALRYTRTVNWRAGPRALSDGREESP